MPTTDPIPATITIVGWVDPVVDATGFTPDSAYVETCYLPRLGPTSFVAYRYGAQELRGRNQRVIDLTEMAQNLGLRSGVSRNAPVVLALSHLQAFGLRACRENNNYLLRLTAPPLTDRQAARLPAKARRMHYAVLASRRPNRP
ncbi:MAG TPA: hypothetical protein VHT75_02940 [Acidimicrobiales bacterium]|nr:hypothetical protein [Acidimicrobiales bacterium]